MHVLPHTLIDSPTLLHTQTHTQNTTKHQQLIMIKNPFCRPRFRPSSAAAKKSDGFSPMSLLDRLREAVFRLIMISALSKGSNAPQRHRSPAEPPADHYYYPNDHHHSEAVADCIEFIKKSTTTTDDDELRHSTGGAAYVDAAVIPLQVM